MFTGDDLDRTSDSVLLTLLRGVGGAFNAGACTCMDVHFSPAESVPLGVVGGKHRGAEVMNSSWYRGEATTPSVLCGVGNAPLLPRRLLAMGRKGDTRLSSTLLSGSAGCA